MLIPVKEINDLIKINCKEINNITANWITF